MDHLAICCFALFLCSKVLRLHSIADTLMSQYGAVLE